MNIFILDRDPVVAAEQCCDAHVCKIILEVAQMMGIAHHLSGTINVPINFAKTHKNNHVSKWVRETKGNYEWTGKHGMALCQEYEFRYGKIHQYKEKIIWMCNNIPSIIPDGDLTEFTQAVAEDCYDDDPVVAYHVYYKKYKKKFAKWKNRPIPDWFK